MLQRLLLSSVCILTAGCDVNLETIYALLNERKPNAVVLVDTPTVFGSATTTLVGATPLEVVGSDTSVCFVLASNIALRDQRILDEAFNKAVVGLQIQVDLALPDGKAFRMGRPQQAWRLHGRVLKNEELAACTSPPCGTRLTLGGVVAVRVSASRDFPVKGVYWNSEQSPAEVVGKGSSAPSRGASRTAEAGATETECSRQGYWSPNPSIEATSQRPLRALWSAPHVER